MAPQSSAFEESQTQSQSLLRLEYLQNGDPELPFYGQQCYGALGHSDADGDRRRLSLRAPPWAVAAGHRPSVDPDRRRDLQARLRFAPCRAARVAGIRGLSMLTNRVCDSTSTASACARRRDARG